jgi:hypothetical protein
MPLFLSSRRLFLALQKHLLNFSQVSFALFPKNEIFNIKNNTVLFVSGFWRQGILSEVLASATGWDLVLFERLYWMFVMLYGKNWDLLQCHFPRKKHGKELQQGSKIFGIFQTIGAIDGKHINIQCPINAGSTFFNYKGSHSVVLLALVDADYKFTAIDIGSYGRNSDDGVFSASEMGERFHNTTFNVPESAPLVENGEPQPYVVVGDEAFPLKTYMLRPYSRKTLGDNEPKKIFNYRLSRARRVVENAFGILAAHWRCFRRYLEVQPEFVDKIVLASCCLHNMRAGKTFEADTGSINLPEAALLTFRVRACHIVARAL